MSKIKYSITEFAKIFNSTRQTLIYYDKIGIFKPEIIETNGYRYYTEDQIKDFGKILQFRNLGIKLEDIHKIINNKNNDEIIQILDHKLNEINQEIDELNIIKLHLLSRKHSFMQNFDEYHLESIFVKEYPMRYAMYTTLKTQGDNLQADIDLCFTEAIKNFYQVNNLPYNGIGVSYNLNACKSSHYFKDFHVAILVEHQVEGLALTKIMPTQYLCMYKFGLHSDTSQLKKLIDYANQNGYEIIGDILDLCIIDNYYSSSQKDLCCLQAPIKKKISN